MKVEELIKILQHYPDDYEVRLKVGYFENGRWGWSAERAINNVKVDLEKRNVELRGEYQFEFK